MSDAMKQLLTHLAMHHIKFEVTGEKTIEIDDCIQITEYKPNTFELMVREIRPMDIFNLVRKVRL